MALLDFVADLPEEKREAFLAEAKNAVIVDSKETAQRLFREHQVLKSAYDAEISLSNLKHDEKFKSETLPKLIEEEVKKRNPSKDPRDLKLEELERKILERDREIARKENVNKALDKLKSLGVPIELDILGLLVAESEQETLERVEKYAGSISTWHEKSINEIKAGVASTPSPRAGNSGAVTFDKMTPSAVMEYAKRGPTEMAEVIAWQKSSKRN